MSKILLIGSTGMIGSRVAAEARSRGHELTEATRSGGEGRVALEATDPAAVAALAGLLFVDFESGDILQLTGAAEILWEDGPVIARFPGAQRGWRFALDEGSLLRGAVNVVWEFGSFSQVSLKTGTWFDVQ